MSNTVVDGKNAAKPRGLQLRISILQTWKCAAWEGTLHLPLRGRNLDETTVLHRLSVHQYRQSESASDYDLQPTLPPPQYLTRESSSRGTSGPRTGKGRLPIVALASSVEDGCHVLVPIRASSLLGKE